MSIFLFLFDNPAASQLRRDDIREQQSIHPAVSPQGEVVAGYINVTLMQCAEHCTEVEQLMVFMGEQRSILSLFTKKMFVLSYIEQLVLSCVFYFGKKGVCMVVLLS